MPAAGKLFRVTPRTVRNWEAGRAMVPYAAFKLMRILRGYELPGHHWKGYRLIGDTLWSPEGLAFRASDQTWWNLTVRMAHEFRAMMAARRSQEGRQAGLPGARPTPASPGQQGRNGPCPTGLVYSSTRGPRNQETAEKQGSGATGPRPVVVLGVAA